MAFSLHLQVFPVWGSARGRAQGTGMALMQVNQSSRSCTFSNRTLIILCTFLQLATKVNVEYDHQILPAAEGKFFDIELESFNFTGRNFSIIEMMPCARYGYI
jgi:hypothetical protein